MRPDELRRWDEDRQRDAVLVILAAIVIVGAAMTLWPGKEERTAAETVLVLPKDAVRVAACEPYVGERWSAAKGPAYLAYRGEVVGLEYADDGPITLGDHAVDHSERGNGTMRFYTITEQEQRLICPPDYVVSRQIVVG
jgi:hypothetical protein